MVRWLSTSAPLLSLLTWRLLFIEGLSSVRWLEPTCTEPFSELMATLWLSSTILLVEEEAATVAKVSTVSTRGFSTILTLEFDPEFEEGTWSSKLSKLRFLSAIIRRAFLCMFLHFSLTSLTRRLFTPTALMDSVIRSQILCFFWLVIELVNLEFKISMCFLYSSVRMATSLSEKFLFFDLFFNKNL